MFPRETVSAALGSASTDQAGVSRGNRCVGSVRCFPGKQGRRHWDRRVQIRPEFPGETASAARGSVSADQAGVSRGNRCVGSVRCFPGKQPRRHGDRRVQIRPVFPGETASAARGSVSADPGGVSPGNSTSSPSGVSPGNRDGGTGIGECRSGRSFPGKQYVVAVRCFPGKQSRRHGDRRVQIRPVFPGETGASAPSGVSRGNSLGGTGIGECGAGRCFQGKRWSGKRGALPGEAGASCGSPVSGRCSHARRRMAGVHDEARSASSSQFGCGIRAGCVIQRI